MKILLITRKFSKKNLTIPDIFHDVVQRQPNKPCFLFQDEVWTFKEVCIYIKNLLQDINENLNIKMYDFKH